MKGIIKIEKMYPLPQAICNQMFYKSHQLQASRHRCQALTKIYLSAITITA